MTHQRTPRESPLRARDASHISTRAIFAAAVSAIAMLAIMLTATAPTAYATEITTISQSSKATENSLIIMDDPAAALEQGMDITQPVQCETDNVTTYAVSYYIYSGYGQSPYTYRYTKENLTTHLTASIAADLSKMTDGSGWYESSIVNTGETFFVGENDTWKDGDTFSVRLKYPLVGTYDGASVGAYLTVSGTFKRAYGEMYDYSTGVKKNGTFSGNPYTEFGCPAIQMSDLLFAGGYVFNAVDITMKLQFFDAETGQAVSVENSADKASYLSFNSMNYNAYDANTGKKGSFGSIDSYSEDVWLPADKTLKIETLEGGNIKVVESGDYYAALPQAGSFTDYLGGATYNKNRTTFYQNDYFEFYLPREVEKHTGWFSFDSASIGTVRPQDPEKAASVAYPTTGDEVTWSISQQVHQLGENIATHYESFTFTDTLPTGLSYVSAAMYCVKDGVKSDITQSAGTLSHSGSTVSYVFSSSYLENMELASETYELDIVTRITDAAENDADLTNTARVKVNDWEIDATAKTHPSRVTVTKAWDDSEDCAGIRPASVSCTIVGTNGTVRNAVIVNLASTDDWTATASVPRYNEDGSIAHYQIKELSVNGYTSTTKGAANTGYTITNSLHLSGTATITAKKTLNGNAPGSDRTFTFELKDTATGATVASAQSDKSGDIVFKPIEYTMSDVGEHVYTITEVDDGQEFIVYDDHAETVKVTVAQGAGATLSADVDYDDDGALFENEYLQPVEMPVSGEGGMALIIAAAAAVIAAGLAIGFAVSRSRAAKRASGRPQWKPFDD